MGGGGKVRLGSGCRRRGEGKAGEWVGEEGRGEGGEGVAVVFIIIHVFK